MGLFDLLKEGYQKLYDEIDECIEEYERDHTMTEEDYIYPGCMLKAKVIAESEWMEGKYPLSYRMACDQAKLDWYRTIDGNTYKHKDV